MKRKVELVATCAKQMNGKQGMELKKQSIKTREN